MIVRSIDASGDWNFGKGKADYLSMSAAINQNIQTRLQSFRGDCFFDATSGVDWWALLGSKNATGLILAIRTAIMNTYGVKQILELSAVLDDNRNLRISYSVSTVYSNQDVVTGTVGVP